MYVYTKPLLLQENLIMILFENFLLQHYFLTVHHASSPSLLKVNIIGED